MLSYILPVEDKSPLGSSKVHLELALEVEPTVNGKTSTPLSKETSISSFASDGTTATVSHGSMTPTSYSDKGKPKLTINGGKHQTLKRVSFGSSKGSMVETLIYEASVQEESEGASVPENDVQIDQDQTETEREKVRVSFFQQSKPQEVDLPDESNICTDTEIMMMAATVALNDANHITYNRTESVESGWDNPFQPGGDLSREADEIVELIKGGKPITPTPGSTGPPLPSLDQHDGNNTSGQVIDSPKRATQLNAAAPKNANGSLNDKSASVGAFEVQRGTVVPAGDASQVEHITIKKKPKCKCCVIQ